MQDDIDVFRRDACFRDSIIKNRTKIGHVVCVHTAKRVRIQKYPKKCGKAKQVKAKLHK